MAIVVCTIDTETQDMSVTLDGTEVADASYFNAMKYKNYEGEMKAGFYVESRKESENKDYQTTTCIMSKGSKEGQEAIKAGKAIASPAYPDLILVKKNSDPREDEMYKKFAAFMKG